MENLTFAKYWVRLSAAEKSALSGKTGISLSYLSQVAHGHRQAGRKTITALVSADPAISLAMFFSEAVHSVSA